MLDYKIPMLYAKYNYWVKGYLGIEGRGSTPDDVTYTYAKSPGGAYIIHGG